MSICPRCGTEFSCGMVDDKSGAPCWCTQYPSMPLPPPTAASGSPEASCYCPACLKLLSEAAAVAEKAR